MDVRLSPEQEALRDTASRVTESLAPKTVADLDDVDRATKLDAAVASAGWRELRASEEDDQPLASGVEAAVVAEALGRSLADTAYIGPTLAVDLRRRVGVEPSTALETVAVSSDLCALAGTEQRLQPARTTTPTTATAVDARASEHVIVAVPADGGYVIASAPFVSSGAALDITRSVGEVLAEAATELPQQLTPLTDEELDGWTALAIALTCADLVGVMRGAIQLGCDYAGIRQQYGASIGSFQAVQHLLADAFVAAEGSQSVALHAAWAVDALPAHEALAAARVAKAYCSRAATFVCEAVIQVHGGIGNTWECLAHVYLRRAHFSSRLFGGVGESLQHVLAARGMEPGAHGLQ